MTVVDMGQVARTLAGFLGFLNQEEERLLSVLDDEARVSAIDSPLVGDEEIEDEEIA